MELRRDPPRGPIDVGSDPELAARIRDEIRDRGPMTFARFIERALYEPGLGYYRRPKPGPGRDGDFLTAPETHPIFGRAIARQLEEAWERLGRPARFVLREHGAGEGALAAAVLGGLDGSGSPLRAAIRYQPVEVEDARREALHARLEAAGLGDVLEPARGPVEGVVLANEVLDALPVHRLVRRGGRLVERFVVIATDAPGPVTFAEIEGEPSSAALLDRLAADGVELVDGQVAEVCLALDDWIAAASGPLTRGLLVLIDYGHPAAELYGPRRMAGSLRAYVNHRVHDDVLINVGRQDLTTHVDVTAVERAAVAAGLVPLGTTTQAEFLVGLGVEAELRAAQANPATTLERYVALRSGLHRLLDPRTTGSFKVMVFATAFNGESPLAGLAFRLPGH